MTSTIKAKARHEITRPTKLSRGIEMTAKLTPALRRWLAFIAEGGQRGRMVLQITASGGRASSQLQALRNAGRVEYCHDLNDLSGLDCIRLTDAGKKALAGSAAGPVSYRRDEDRYIVYLGDDRLGFVRRDPTAAGARCWKAVDTWLAWSCWYKTRNAAGKALLRRYLAVSESEREER